MSDSLWPHGLYSPWNSPGQNTGVGSISLFQRFFPAQGLNLALPHCRRILYQLSHKKSLRILKWVAYPFFRGSSRPRNPTGVSCIADRFFTNSAMREAHMFLHPVYWKKKNQFRDDIPLANSDRYIHIHVWQWVIIYSSLYLSESFSPKN